MKQNIKIGWLSAVITLIFGVSMVGAPAQAQRVNAEDWGHRVLRDRILHDAHDRYDVQFLSTRVEPLGYTDRGVSGKGVFLRHGKNPQRFTYHVLVKRDGRVSDVGYNIR